MLWRRRDIAGELCAKLVLMWSGLSIGVALLATPAKFRAASLSLPVALEIGRETFRIYNAVEVLLGLIVVVLAANSTSRRRWGGWLTVPLAIVAVQVVWLSPLLAARTDLVQAGADPGPSPAHALYIAGETLKIGLLAIAGFRFDPNRIGPESLAMPQSSWVPLGITGRGLLNKRSRHSGISRSTRHRPRLP